MTSLLLGLVVESPWSALGGPFLSSFARMASKTVFWPCRASISGSEAIFSLSRGGHWPRAVTIASSLDSGCGLSHECPQDGCNDTCQVRSFKTHLKWKYGMFRGS